MRLAQGGCVERRPRVTPPFPALAQASRGIGHTLLTLDSDGPVRRIAPIVQIGERTLPSFSIATVMHTGGAPVMRVEPDPTVSAPRSFRGEAQPITPAACRPSHALFYDLFYSQQQLIEGQKPGIDPALFKDRIVVVGVSAEGLHEVFTTPFPVGEINGPRCTPT